MKKISYIFLFLVLFLLSNTIVYAGNCDKYACAKCVYKFERFNLTYNVESSGKKPVEVSTSNDFEGMNASDKISIVDNVAKKVFVSDSTNKIVCPNVLNYKMVPLNRGMNGTEITLYSDSDHENNMIVKLKDQKNNDKTVTDSTKKNKSCTYSSKIVTTQAQADGPKVTIDTDGDKDIAFSFSDPSYKKNDITSDITAEFFKDYMDKSGCPELFVSCGGSNIGPNQDQSKFCSITKKSQSVKPERPSESTEDKDADETQKDIAKEYGIGRKPGIHVNIDLTNKKCGVLSEEMLNWLQWALDIIRISGLVLTVVLGISDYMSASFASNEEGMTKANKNFTTRIFCLGFLFLVPTIIEFLLTLLNIGATAKSPSCGLK